MLKKKLKKWTGMCLAVALLSSATLPVHAGPVISFIKCGNDEDEMGSVYYDYEPNACGTVSNLKQPTNISCKSTALAQALNIIEGADNHTSDGHGKNMCKSNNGKIYTGVDGKKYKATYKTDSYVGTKEELQGKIDASMDASLPIVVTVHKTTKKGTKHHWVTIVSKTTYKDENGKDKDTYLIIDPATGTQTTLINASYDLGLTDSNPPHYGYICFTETT